IAAVERMSGGSDASSDAGDYNLVVSTIYLCAQRLHAGEGGCAVGAGRKIRKPRNPPRKSCEHGIAMADGFIARQAQAPIDIARRVDEAFLHTRAKGTPCEA